MLIFLWQEYLILLSYWVGNASYLLYPCASTVY